MRAGRSRGFPRQGSELGAPCCAPTSATSTSTRAHRPPRCSRWPKEVHGGCAVVPEPVQTLGMTGYRAAAIVGDAAAIAALKSLRSSTGTASPEFVQAGRSRRLDRRSTMWRHAARSSRPNARCSETRSPSSATRRLASHAGLYLWVRRRRRRRGRRSKLLEQPCGGVPRPGVWARRRGVPASGARPYARRMRSSREGGESVSDREVIEEAYADLDKLTDARRCDRTHHRRARPRRTPGCREARRRLGRERLGEGSDHALFPDHGTPPDGGGPLHVLRQDPDQDRPGRPRRAGRSARNCSLRRFLRARGGGHAWIRQHRGVRRSGTMVDTWATVGSCAQIGQNVHLSGGVGIGGVLEPPGASPVIIEDGAFIGSRSIVVEGVIIEEEAVLGANTTITSSTPIIDVTGPNRSRCGAGFPPVLSSCPGTRPKAVPRRYLRSAMRTDHRRRAPPPPIARPRSTMLSGRSG